MRHELYMIIYGRIWVSYSGTAGKFVGNGYRVINLDRETHQLALPG